MSVHLRIVVVDPPPGVAWALQLGKSELRPPIRASAKEVVFEFEVNVDGTTKTGGVRFLGPAVQGPPDGRFVYLSSGKRAGTPGSCWDRRAKIPLGGITAAILAKVNATRVLEARITGRARDGGPACASVPILGPWKALGA
jgi:Family of unknown function (DUF5990)